MPDFHSSGECEPPEIHLHDRLEGWIEAAVSNIAAALQRDLDGKGQASLLVSGGSTPAPVYLALAQQSIDWAKVEIALVDERWLPIDDPDSNATLIRKSLMIGRAASANFRPLRLPGQSLTDAVLAANQTSSPATLAILGMGPDGHTASLFPNMSGLDQALNNPAYYVGVDAAGCSGAGPWPKRISMTPAGLAKAGTRLLLIRGQQKRELIEEAFAGDDPHELPIRAVLSLPGAPLQIHWCP
jgi:6-phosphogluconolactonase